MSCSVPFGEGRSLPINVLEEIAEHLVVSSESPKATPTTTPSSPYSYLYTPPTDSTLPPCLPVGIARLTPLLAVSKAIYEALSPGYAVSASNGDAYPLRTELYARLCAYFLDVKAAGRRWRYAKRRKAGEEEGGWDRDVEGVTNEGLTAHFVQVVKALRFFKRAARAMDIPLPPQAFAGTPPKPKGEAGGGIAHLYEDTIEQILLRTFTLMLEDDGKNHHQLRLVSAPLFVDMLVFHRLNEGTGGHGVLHGGTGPLVKYNDGWPVENVLNTAAVWCIWLFTTEEKVQSESLPVREELIRLVLPFVLCPYRYASALVPPTHYTLPLPTPTEDLQDVYQKPLSTHTAHGQFPVYHCFPYNTVPPPPAVVPSSSTPPTPVAAPAPVAAAAPLHAAAAAAAAFAVAHQQDQEAMDVDEEEEEAEVPALEAGPDAPPVAILHNEANRDDDEGNANGDVAGADVPAPNAPADALNPAPPANDNPPPPVPNAAPAPAANANVTPPALSSATPPPGHTLHISRRPPPSTSNSQAHPSFGTYVPWYCSPWKENGGPGVHQHLQRAPLSQAYASSTPAALSALPPPSSSPKPIQATTTSIPSSSSSSPSNTSQRGITIHLPLISAAAKLVFMSRREAIPLPVIPSLPVNRAAAIAAGWRFAGPTQEDLREMGGWCTWGRRTVWKRVPSQGAEGEGAQQNAGAGENGQQEQQQDEAAQNAVQDVAVAKVEDKPLWYADSQRWDNDWWRTRLCGGQEWQTRHTSLLSTLPKPLDTLPPPPLYKRPHETLAWRTGRVYERGMLSGLWQGYMHMPNESSLMYVAHTRQFPSNFGEQALGVMMRPVLVRFAEHSWVARPGDPGKFRNSEKEVGCELDEEKKHERKCAGKRRKGCGKRYWERSMVCEENEGVDEEKYEYVEPGGEGPVPVPRPTTMVKHLAPLSPRFDPLLGEMREGNGQTVPIPTRVGFLDENMNNAWFPGPVGSLKWDEGTIVPTPEGSTKQASAEEGVWDGVWRDRYVSRMGEEEEGKRLKMKGVTFSIPTTFERGDGVEVVQTPRRAPAAPLEHAAAAAAAAVAVGAAPAAAVPAPNIVAPAPAAAPATTDGLIHVSPRVVTRLDNPNLPLPEPSSDAPSSSPRVRPTPRKVIPPSSHIYETYDPSGVREGVHERMERARGSACRGLRKRRKSDNGREPGEHGDSGVMAREEVHVYPHPGCLGCRERERVLERQREEVGKARRERRKERMVRGLLEALEERRIAMSVVRSQEVQEMFGNVGLGLPVKKVEGEEDEDEEMKVEEFGMEAEDDDMEDEESDWESESDMQEHEDEDEKKFCGCLMCKGGLGSALLSDDSDDSDSDSDDEDLDSDIEDDDELDLEDSTTLGSSFPPCTSTSSLSDSIITGSMDERHAEAWGNFTYYGRVRPWDGLIGILRIGTREENMGTKFFFYGYVYGGRNFVGNWRFAGMDAVSVGMESSFVLTRRGEV